MSRAKKEAPFYGRTPGKTTRGLKRVMRRVKRQNPSEYEATYVTQGLRI